MASSIRRCAVCDRYGEPLSPEGHRLASLLHRAIRKRSPITIDIQIRLAQLLAAPWDPQTTRYGAALHRQKLIELLECYDREIKRRRLRGLE
jgi:hypothetical protein